jgi:hypothetical protein
MFEGVMVNKSPILNNSAILLWYLFLVILACIDPILRMLVMHIHGGIMNVVTMQSIQSINVQTCRKVSWALLVLLCLCTQLFVHSFIVMCSCSCSWFLLFVHVHVHGFCFLFIVSSCSAVFVIYAFCSDFHCFVNVNVRVHGLCLLFIVSLWSSMVIDIIVFYLFMFIIPCSYEVIEEVIQIWCVLAGVLIYQRTVLCPHHYEFRIYTEMARCYYSLQLVSG